MGVTALLVALVFTAVNALQERTRTTSCLSNLRQIGVALSLYVTDHDNTLPGPIWTSGAPQFYVYDGQDNTDRGRQLARWLQPYLQSPDPIPVWAWLESEMFKCPAYMRAVPQNVGRGQRRPYIVNNGDDGSFTTPDGTVVRPFGRGLGVPPARYNRLAADFRLATTWAMVDLDQGTRFHYNMPWAPERPVHGAVRNVLFFDWHVESVPVGNPLVIH